MAAPVFTLANMAVDAAFDDLTVTTGGNSLVIGFTGSDWLWYATAYPNARAKLSGGDTIATSLFNDVGSPPGQGGWSYRTKTSQIHDCNSFGGGDDNLAHSDPGSISITIPAGQAATGMRYTVPCDQNLRTFVWAGALLEGTYTVTATLTNGSASPISVVLPVAGGANTDAWFKVTVRTVLATTLTMEIRRTTANANVGRIVPQAATLQIAAPPRVGGGSMYLQYLGLYGGSN